MDLDMPVKDGITATKDIVKDFNTNIHPTTILALSAYAGQSQKMNSIEAGMSAFSNQR
jgi:CheY-like chemotaxis protein